MWEMPILLFEIFSIISILLMVVDFFLRKIPAMPQRCFADYEKIFNNSCSVCTLGE